MNLTLRMAIDLYNELKKIALEDERSINGEINYIIKKYIEEKRTLKRVLLLLLCNLTYVTHYILYEVIYFIYIRY